MMIKSIQVLLTAIAFSAPLVAQQTFTLTSEDLGGQATSNEEFNGFGCTGKNQSPQLSWKNAPEGTKSFAITMYDLQRHLLGADGGIGESSTFLLLRTNLYLMLETQH